MNGSNLLEEADRKPFALCPLCLRKIETYLQFESIEDLISRFAKILGSIQNMQNSAFEREERYLSNILTRLRQQGYSLKINDLDIEKMIEAEDEFVRPIPAG